MTDLANALNKKRLKAVNKEQSNDVSDITELMNAIHAGEGTYGLNEALFLKDGDIDDITTMFETNISQNPEDTNASLYVGKVDTDVLVGMAEMYDKVFTAKELNDIGEIALESGKPTLTMELWDEGLISKNLRQSVLELGNQPPITPELEPDGSLFIQDVIRHSSKAS